MRLLLPKTFVQDSEINQPLFFLAGPVNGGGNWQEKCCTEIAKLIPDFLAVVPCRWQSKDNLFCYRVSGIEDAFSRQTRWEYHYLKLAAQKSKEHKGCIIFWLPNESKTQPRNDGQPYARDTLGELGYWRAHLEFYKSMHLVVGAEPDFPGLSVIRENFRLSMGAEFPFYLTLEETARRAVKWVEI